MTSSMGSASSSLVQASHPWTEAENAAGFVLRYLVPVRQQLLRWTSNESIADESLKRLIAHLVTQGFGVNGKGRIRDFLIRGIRSATKSVIADIPEAKRPNIDFTNWTFETPEWIAIWRNGLLARAWRSLERLEHKDRSKPYYTVLHAATEYPAEDAGMLVIRINTLSDLHVEKDAIKEYLKTARALFGEMLKHEIAETLDRVDEVNVSQEIKTLGLSGIFATPNS